MGFWPSGAFPQTVGRAAGKSGQSSFFCKSCLRCCYTSLQTLCCLCWYVYVSMERECYLISFGMKYPITPLPCPWAIASTLCVGNVVSVEHGAQKRYVHEDESE